MFLARFRFTPQQQQVVAFLCVVSFFLGGIISKNESGSLFQKSNISEWEGGSSSQRSNQQSISSGSDSDGWKTINVYYGDRKTEIQGVRSHGPSQFYFPISGKKTWHGQFEQDRIVHEILSSKMKKEYKGFFIDLAANYPVFISNTVALERDHGWEGLCIEPRSEEWMGLAFRQCTVIGAVLGKEKNEEITFTHHEIPGHAGIVGKGLANKPGETSSEMTEKRRTATMQDILSRFNAPKVIDYFSLDVEGAEELVLSAFPFKEYKILTLSVEHPSKKVVSLLTKNGLKLHTTAGVDQIWVHSSLA